MALSAVNPILDPQTSARLPQVVERLGILTSRELEVIEHVLAQLEIHRTATELSDTTDDLEAKGVIERLPQIIAEVRARHPQSSAY